MRENKIEKGQICDSVGQLGDHKINIRKAKHIA